VQLQFVDKDGKQVVQRNTTLKPGGSEWLEFPFVGGSAGIDLRAQCETLDAKLGSFLRPTLGILENSSGKTVQSIGPEGFKEAGHGFPIGFTPAPTDRRANGQSVGQSYPNPTGPGVGSNKAAIGNNPIYVTPFGLQVTTSAIPLEQGQTARFEVKNSGDEPVWVRLQFVDKVGKVLVQREAKLKSGGAEIVEFTGPNNPLMVANEKAAANPKGPHVEKSGVELRPQLGADEKSIDFLRPAFWILENSSGKTLQSIGPEGFKKVEQLGPPVTRPNDDLSINDQLAGQGFPLGHGPCSSVTFSNDAQQNILQRLEASGSFKSLLQMIKATDLAEMLTQPDSNVTLFAPCDAALAKWPNGKLEALTTRYLKQLKESLLNHMVVGRFAYQDLINESQIGGTDFVPKPKAAGGAYLYVIRDNGSDIKSTVTTEGVDLGLRISKSQKDFNARSTIKVRDNYVYPYVRLNRADVITSTGVIHVIDQYFNLSSENFWGD